MGRGGGGSSFHRSLFVAGGCGVIGSHFVRHWLGAFREDDERLAGTGGV